MLFTNLVLSIITIITSIMRDNNGLIPISFKKSNISFLPVLIILYSLFKNYIS